MQGRRVDRLDADDPRRTLDGGGDAGHQAAATDGDQDGVDALPQLGELLEQLQPRVPAPAQISGWS